MKDDLISRQAAIAHAVPLNLFGREVMMVSVSELENLPPAQPERTKGRWIKMSDADGVYYCCSECGEELYRLWSFDREFDLVPHKVSIAQTRYCPNCGVDMRGKEQHETD